MPLSLPTERRLDGRRVTAIDPSLPASQLLDSMRERWDRHEVILVDSASAPVGEARLDVDGSDVALLQRTSGTTGVPRMFAFARAGVREHAAATARAMDVRPGCRVAMAIRAGTAYYTSVVLMSLFNDTALVVFDPLDIDSAIRAILERRIDTFDAGVRFWQTIALKARRDPAVLDALADLSVRGVGGDPLPRSVEAHYRDNGIPLANGYGLTQAGPNVAIGLHASATEGSCGRPLDGVECTIRDGELVIRSPFAALGEVVNHRIVDPPERDDDGWLRTGDGAQIIDGEIVPLGRLRDQAGTAS